MDLTESSPCKIAVVMISYYSFHHMQKTGPEECDFSPLIQPFRWKRIKRRVSSACVPSASWTGFGDGDVSVCWDIPVLAIDRCVVDPAAEDPLERGDKVGSTSQLVTNSR